MTVTTTTIISFKMPEEAEQHRIFCENDSWSEEWAVETTTAYISYRRSETYLCEAGAAE